MGLKIDPNNIEDVIKQLGSAQSYLSSAVDVLTSISTLYSELEEIDTVVQLKKDISTQYGALTRLKNGLSSDVREFARAEEFNVRLIRCFTTRRGLFQ